MKRQELGDFKSRHMCNLLIHRITGTAIAESCVFETSGKTTWVFKTLRKHTCLLKGPSGVGDDDVLLRRHAGLLDVCRKVLFCDVRMAYKLAAGSIASGYAVCLDQETET